MYVFEVRVRWTKGTIIPRIYLDNLSNCLLQTPEKFRCMASTGFEPMSSLCDAAAMLYHLSYEATQLGANQFVGKR